LKEESPEEHQFKTHLADINGNITRALHRYRDKFDEQMELWGKELSLEEMENLKEGGELKKRVKKWWPTLASELVQLILKQLGEDKTKKTQLEYWSSNQDI